MKQNRNNFSLFPIKKVPLDAKGSGLIYVILIMVVAAFIGKDLLLKQLTLNKINQKLTKRVRYEEVFDVLANQLYEAQICTEALVGQTITAGAYNEVELTLKIPQLPGKLAKNTTINQVKIKSVVARAVKFNRVVKLYAPDSRFNYYEAELYIVPDGISDYFSMSSAPFKSNFKIEMGIYTKNNKVVSCFGNNSASDICTRMGSAYNTSTSPLINDIRCQPDLSCYVSTDSVVTNPSVCKFPYSPTAVSPTHYICQWCNPF